MYNLMNQYAQTVVGTIPPDHVKDYEWLIQNVGDASQQNYQDKYRQYWRMDVAQLSPSFYAAYFGALNSARTNTPTLSFVAQTLHAPSARKKVRRVRKVFSSRSQQN